MSSTASIDSIIPNLPGFKPRVVHSGRAAKRQIFKHVEGQLFIAEAPPPPLEDVDIGNTSIMVASMSSPSQAAASARAAMSSTSSIAPPSALNSTRRMLGLDEDAESTGGWPVLQFGAYFAEDVLWSPQERRRGRRVIIRYYTCDDTLSIAEARTVNSGLLQGPILKRCSAPKQATASGGEGGYVTAEDIHLGQTVTICSRDYYIVEASEVTRRFLMDRLGRSSRDVPANGTFRYPDDEGRVRQQQLADMAAPTKPKGSIALAVGLYNVDNSGRAKFLKYGNQCLSFTCVWDDRSKTYGDLLNYQLIYHLADDTVEVVSAPSPATAGRDVFKVLLRRGKLPKDITRPHEGHYTWRDFSVGMVINLYCRMLQVVDADASTRQFYQENGMPLPAPIADEPRLALTFEREIPPPTGFGSEEDSMLSVTGSIGGGGKILPRRGEVKTLSFTARLKSTRPEDQGRRFIIQYFLWDCTVKIYEPAVRNSGFAGGTYLSRNSVKTTTGAAVNEDSFVVGDDLPLAVGTFIILDAGESTWRHMEAHPRKFPLSNVKGIFARVRERLYDAANSGDLQHAILDEVERTGQPPSPSRAASAGMGSGEMSVTAIVTDMINRGLVDGSEDAGGLDTMSFTSGGGPSMTWSAGSESLDFGNSIELGMSGDIRMSRDQLVAVLERYRISLHHQELTSLFRALVGRRRPTPGAEHSFRAKKLIYQILTPTEDFA